MKEYKVYFRQRWVGSVWAGNVREAILLARLDYLYLALNGGIFVHLRDS